MGSLIGGSNKSSQSQSSSGLGVSKSTQGSTSSSTGVSNSNSFSKSGLSADQVLAQFGAGKQDNSMWSKDSAISDVQGVLRQQATDALQSVMPSIAKVDRSAGAYNSTTRDLLHNDANARITSQLSKTALDAITQYGQLGNQTTANNNQLLSSLSGVAKDTGSSGSTGNSTQISDSTSFGNSGSTQVQTSEGSGGTKGGSGLLGLFGLADGGEVPKQPDMMQSFMDMSGLSNQLMNFKDMKDGTEKLAKGSIKDGVKGFMSEQDKEELKQLEAGYKILSGLFANGGTVEDAGSTPSLPPLPGFTFNFEGGSDQSKPASASSDMADMEMMSQLLGLFANGGKVDDDDEASEPSPDDETAEKMAMAPEMPGFTFNFGVAGSNNTDSTRKKLGFANGGKVSPERDLQMAMQKYAMGGQVRSGEADVQAGGKIRGKQSPQGKDNQVIGVAGGEGIIPKDVMDVPGVSEWLDKMIEQYHTPVNKGG